MGSLWSDERARMHEDAIPMDGSTAVRWPTTPGRGRSVYRPLRQKSHSPCEHTGRPLLIHPSHLPQHRPTKGYRRSSPRAASRRGRPLPPRLSPMPLGTAAYPREGLGRRAQSISRPRRRKPGLRTRGPLEGSETARRTDHRRRPARTRRRSGARADSGLRDQRGSHHGGSGRRGGGRARSPSFESMPA